MHDLLAGCIVGVVSSLVVGMGVDGWMGVPEEGAVCEGGWHW